MTRVQIINTVISALNFRRYLEIGVEDGDCFSQIRCVEKVGVDPCPIYKDGVIAKTSDEFFDLYDGAKFDFIFIDGLHHAEQVLRDIENSLEILSDGGLIMCHDCLPTSELMQRIPRPQRLWNGDVWKAIHHIRVHRADLSVLTLDTDWGCSLIERRVSVPYEQRSGVVDWDYFVRHSAEFMNIVAPEFLFSFLKNRKPL